MTLTVLSWNVFHGRDFPPDPSLRTLRSRLLRLTERNETHAGVNADLSREFAAVIAGAEWDLALLQECPPRWRALLERVCAAESQLSLTSRNWLAPLRCLAARINPDLIASNEGGSNLTLARPGTGGIARRRELVLAPGPRPERRTMAFTELRCGVCAANLHASSGPSNRPRAEAELRRAAACAVGWAAGRPLVFGGDLNVRPRESPIYDELRSRYGLVAPTAPDSLDHVLARGLRVERAPARLETGWREVPRPDGLRVRLSDHDAVLASFASARAREAWVD